jgi:hypothetical protein
MKLAICDNCGATDDATQNDVPFHYAGVLLKFRCDNATEFETLEICEQCKRTFLSLFPKLIEALKGQREGRRPPTRVAHKRKSHRKTRKTSARENARH